MAVIISVVVSVATVSYAVSNLWYIQI
jgi:hypothetical protein